MLHLLKGPGSLASGCVIATFGNRCRVRFSNGDRELAVHRSIESLAPGDEVHADDIHVVQVLPRRTWLQRRDPGKRARKLVIVANVDVVAIVVSCVSPPLHPRLIDRYLAAIWQGGAEPVIVLNKVDLHPTSTEVADDLRKLNPYAEMEVPVIPVSANVSDGIEQLVAVLQGKTSVLVGHSGVGKSSLLNALIDAGQEIGSVSAANLKGRHTTTHSSLHDAGGMRIIDTPGVREFGVDFESPEELSECFPDFPPGCRYPNCLHLAEEGCAVLHGLAAGSVNGARYDSYRRLLLDAFPDRYHPPDEGFLCRNCGNAVSSGGGTKHRNHCPFCLHSVHLDRVPGDRLAGCAGIMEPVAVWVRKGGEWAIIHRCRTCGHLSSNRIASDDNELLLMSMAVQPLSKPPWPLDRVAS